MKPIDLTNQKFGKLKVLYRLKYSKTAHTYLWLCQCDCGNIIEVSGNNLRSGHTKSCGCLKLEKQITHNLSKTRLYSIYNNMKARCYNPKNPYFYNYGGRGISICDEWLNDFCSFYNWAVNNGYDSSLFIDRINNNGNYEPNNCRWVTPKENSNNKRNNKYILYKGETHTIAQWAEILEINAHTLRNRMYRNLTFEQAINQ